LIVDISFELVDTARTHLADRINTDGPITERDNRTCGARQVFKTLR
jgi:hypothetical protein